MDDTRVVPSEQRGSCLQINLEVIIPLAERERLLLLLLELEKTVTSKTVITCHSISQSYSFTCYNYTFQDIKLF